jgi:hypothetical protein
MGDTRNAYRNLVGKPLENAHFNDRDGRITLRWIVPNGGL